MVAGRRKPPARVYRAPGLDPGAGALQDSDDAVAQLQRAIGGALPAVRAFLSTGIPVLDRALGRGLPEGRIVEIYGPESCGKSALVEHLIHTQVKGCGNVAVDIDMEGTRDEGRLWRWWGLRMRDFVYYAPATVEEANASVFMALELLKGRELPTAVTYDSIAGGCTREEAANTEGAQRVRAAHAAIFNDFFRRVHVPLREARATLVMTNQQRPGREGQADVTFGGSGIRFFASVRLRLQIISQIRTHAEGTWVEPQGQVLLAHVVKNKLAPGHRKVLIPVWFDRGIHVAGSLLLTLHENGRLVRASERTWQVPVPSGPLRLELRQTSAYGRFEEFDAWLRERPERLNECLELLWPIPEGPP